MPIFACGVLPTTMPHVHLGRTIRTIARIVASGAGYGWKMHGATAETKASARLVAGNDPVDQVAQTAYARPSTKIGEALLTMSEREFWEALRIRITLYPGTRSSWVLEVKR